MEVKAYPLLRSELPSPRASVTEGRNHLCTMNAERPHLGSGYLNPHALGDSAVPGQAQELSKQLFGIIFPLLAPSDS